MSLLCLYTLPPLSSNPNSGWKGNSWPCECECESSRHKDEDDGPHLLRADRWRPSPKRSLLVRAFVRWQERCKKWIRIGGILKNKFPSNVHGFVFITYSGTVWNSHCMMVKKWSAAPFLKWFSAASQQWSSAAPQQWSSAASPPWSSACHPRVWPKVAKIRQNLPKPANCEFD